MKKEWKLVRNTWISAEPVLPGVWERKDGGHVVRGTATCPRTGKRKDLWRVLPDVTAARALVMLREELDGVRKGVVAAEQPKTPFATYAVSLLKRKIDRGEIRSASGVEKWEMVLKKLIASRLADLFVDEIRQRDVEAWKEDVAKTIARGDYSPNTANTWLSVLKVVMAHAKVDYELPKNVAEDVKNFDTSEHRTYTREQPNSLTSEELRSFLARMLELYPQHFAMAYVGFATGLRPSSLRPLRRCGPEADVKWDENVILIRQSHTVGQVAMKRTKTKKDLEIKVPPELMEVMRWHASTQLAAGPQRESELLFPNEQGTFRDCSTLRKPFRHVAKDVGLTKKITPRAMRRSFQDIARAAEVRDVVTRSISGHATEQMQRHYSTVSEKEQAEGLAKIIRMMDFRDRSTATSEASANGSHTGVGACVGA